MTTDRAGRIHHGDSRRRGPCATDSDQPHSGRSAPTPRGGAITSAAPSGTVRTAPSPPTALHICTWLYAESEVEESSYPQVPGRPSSEAFQSTYWRCVATFFASSYRHQPQAKHVLFTNVERLPSVSGVDLSAFLEQLGVDVIRLPLTHVTPRGHFHAWRNQFYVFDIVSYLARNTSQGDAALVLDSDCVWIADAGPIGVALARDGVLTCVETFPVDWREGGLTRKDMSVLASALLGRDVSDPLVYCGGEFLAATGTELGRLNAEIAITWRQLLARYAGGEQVFREEAQMLSYIYHKLAYPLGNASPYVRRIWTGSFGAFNTATPHDLGLVVWHLPAEKRFGLRRLFTDVVDPTSRFWTVQPGVEMRDYLGQILGVPRNRVTKQLRDLGHRISDKLRRG